MLPFAAIQSELLTASVRNDKEVNQLNGSAGPGARPTLVRGAISADGTGGWVILMAGLRGVDNRNITALARNWTAQCLETVMLGMWRVGCQETYHLHVYEDYGQNDERQETPIFCLQHTSDNHIRFNPNCNSPTDSLTEFLKLASLNIWRFKMSIFISE